MNSLFARVLKVAAPYTLCGALGVVALAGEARAQIAPECRDHSLQLSFVNTVTKAAILPGKGTSLTATMSTGKELFLDYHISTNETSPGLYKVSFTHFKGLKRGKETATKGYYEYYQDYDGSNIGSGLAKSCKVIKDPKTGALKSLTITYSSDPAVKADLGSESGTFTVSLRPPTKAEDALKYEVASLKYSVSTKGIKNESLSTTASGTISFPPGGSIGTGGYRNGGTLVALPDYLNPFFTPQEIKDIQRIPSEIAKLQQALAPKADELYTLFTGFRDIMGDIFVEKNVPAQDQTLWLDRLDAATHIAMQAFVTARMGEWTAKTVGNLYELQAIPGSFWNGTVSNAQDTDYNGFRDSNKDFFNNVIGRQLGKKIAGTAPAKGSKESFMRYCGEEALKLVMSTSVNWRKGQQSGIVIRPNDPNVPRFTDPTNPIVNVSLKLWDHASRLGDATRPFFRQIRKLFGLA